MSERCEFPMSLDIVSCLRSTIETNYLERELSNRVKGLKVSDELISAKEAIDKKLNKVVNFVRTNSQKGDLQIRSVGKKSHPHFYHFMENADGSELIYWTKQTEVLQIGLMKDKDSSYAFTQICRLNGRKEIVLNRIDATTLDSIGIVEKLLESPIEEISNFEKGRSDKFAI